MALIAPLQPLHSIAASLSAASPSSSSAPTLRADSIWDHVCMSCGPFRRQFDELPLWEGSALDDSELW